MRASLKAFVCATTKVTNEAMSECRTWGVAYDEKENNNEEGI
jgi:hypothetical protein